jgi:hypothetical protein
MVSYNYNSGIYMSILQIHVYLYGGVFALNYADLLVSAIVEAVK